MIVEHDHEKTYEKLSAYMQQDKNNFLYGLLNYEHPHYSYKSISTNIKIQQIGSSDIVELTYELNDAGIVFQTLNILIEVFLREYSVLKKSQTNAVVDYFQQQLEKSSGQLNTVEDNLLTFNKKNNIVNYYEQTKHISSQQEKIEVKLQDVLMEFQSAEAILKKLEAETQARFKININTKDILDIRKSLIEVKQKLARLEMDKNDSPETTGLEHKLKKNELDLKVELQTKMDSLYVYGRNSEGMSIEVLLNNWLKTVIDYEGARARLLAMQKKSNEFAKLYAQYAPLGATLKRIEREIDVREKEYLEILHHLGLAKLKQQNEEMMAKMKILDHPQLPINSKPTKRKLYIVVIIIFAFIFSLLGFLVFELLDKTIKFPKRMEELSELKVAGTYTFENKGTGFNPGMVNLAGLKSVTEAIMSARNNSPRQPVVIQFLSHWQAEGKTHIINAIKKHLSSIGYSISILNFQSHEYLENGESKAFIKQLRDAKSYYELIQFDDNAIASDIVLSEVPAAANKTFNTALLNTADLSYLVADARRSWEPADDFILKNKKNQIKGNLECILNFIQAVEMTSVIGKTTKKSWYKRFLKN